MMLLEFKPYVGRFCKDEEEISVLQKNAEDDLEQSTQADHMKVY